MSAFADVLLGQPAFHALLTNSGLIAVGVVIGQALVAPPAAWTLARASFPGRKAIIGLYALLLVLPFQALMLPQYLVLQSLGLRNTLWAIIAPGAFSTFPVLIMVVAFRAIPQNVLDSARLDGAGETDVFLRVGLPLGAPGVFAALLMGFFEYWNAVEQPLAFLDNQALWPIALFSPLGNADAMPAMAAAAVIAAIPGLLIFAWGSRYLSEDIAREPLNERRS